MISGSCGGRCFAANSRRTAASAERVHAKAVNGLRRERHQPSVAETVASTGDCGRIRVVRRDADDVGHARYIVVPGRSKPIHLDLAMFEAAEVGRKLAKSDYKAQVPEPTVGTALRAAGASAGLVSGHRPVRRCRHGRQGGNGQPAQRVDGSAMDRHERLHRTLERRARAAATVALLARPAGSRPARDVPERLVFLADHSPRGAPHQHLGVRLAARSGGRFRAGVDRRWRGHREVLDALEQERPRGSG